MFELMPSNVACKSKVSGGEDCLFGKLSVCSAPGGFESDSLPGGLPSISSMSSVSIGLAAICATWFHHVGSKIEKSLYLQLGFDFLSCNDRFSFLEKYDNLIAIESKNSDYSRSLTRYLLRENFHV